MSSTGMSAAITRRLLGVAAAVFAASLITAGTANADTASLGVTDAAGNSDPVAGVGRTFTVAGNSAVPKQVYVRYRATGGAACAPSASSDSGDVPFSSSLFNGASVNGDFSIARTATWTTPGTFMFCIWVAGFAAAPATPITQNVTFRAATGTISGTVAPVAPQPDQDFTVTVTGASEAPKYVYAKVRFAGGAPCATTYSSDQGDSLMSGRSVNGAFALAAVASRVASGNYLICLWLAAAGGDPAPVAGPQPVTFSVVAPPVPPPPPPPCLVPTLTPGTTLANVLSRLTTAQCTLGQRRYVASRRYRRGTLIKLTPAAGTSLAPQSAVSVLLSSGRPCTVPLVRRGMRLSAAKALLARVGCTVGKTRYLSSRRRRGTVVSFNPHSGTRLPPRAIVSARVSRGPGRGR